MALVPYDSLAPYGGPVLRKNVIANSVTVTAYDAVNLDTDGFVALGTAGGGLYGHVMEISTSGGVGVNTTGAAGAEMGSFVGTFTAASDNETDAAVQVSVDVSQLTTYKADPNTGTFGTTTAGSDEAGTYFDLSDEESIDETSVVDTAAQYFSHGKFSSNHIEVNIFESIVFNTV